jgi:hypothetical protein
MVRLLAILLSAFVMGALVYIFDPFVLLAIPLIVVTILFTETHGHRQSHKKPRETESSTAVTER